jgi:hypothetical protein
MEVYRKLQGFYNSVDIYTSHELEGPDVEE